MPHSHKYPANQQPPDQNPIPAAAPPHGWRRPNTARQNRSAATATRSLESWLLSDLGRLSMTTATTTATRPPDNYGDMRPGTPPRTYCTSSSLSREHSCSSSLASGSSFPRSRGRAPSTSSSSSSSSSRREGADDSDGSQTYGPAMEVQGRENGALERFRYEPGGVVGTLRGIKICSDDGRKGFRR